MLYSYIKVKVNGGNNLREACTCSQFTVMFITDESIPTEVKVENISELVYNASTIHYGPEIQKKVTEVLGLSNDFRRMLTLT